MATIVVAEDNKFARTIMNRYLSGTGHTLIMCEDGAVALEQIQKQVPDLVLTDLLMPNLDGLGLLAAIRKDHPDLPCAVLSADIQASTREQVEQFNVIGFINKPYTEEQVRGLVKSVLGEGASLGEG